MKKLLTILCSIILLSSCDTKTVNKKDNYPIEILELKEANKFDTIYTISTEREVYQFDKNNVYIGTYSKTSADGIAIWSITIIFILLICLFLFL